MTLRAIVPLRGVIYKEIQMFLGTPLGAERG